MNNGKKRSIKEPYGAFQNNLNVNHILNKESNADRLYREAMDQ